MIKERNPSEARRALLDLLLREEGLDATPARQIPKRTSEGPAPLSFAQQRLWFLDKLEPGNPFYNVAGSVRLTGRLDVEALERSLGEVVRRHEALRTVFTEEGGQPRQFVAPHAPLRLVRVDLSHLAEDEREAEARRLADVEARTPFDLTSGLLLRAALLRLGETEHALLLTMHHIASDDWSAGVLIREIAALYEAYGGGRPSPLPELSLQYADYAVWQREWLSGETLGKQLDYWRARLEGVPALHLPTDRPRPRVNTHRGTRRHFVVPRATADALKALGRQEGATPFMVLLAAFKVLLWRYSSQADIAVGSAIANRTRSEVEPLIGFFVNTLVLRTDLSGDPTFRELLGRVKDVTVGAYAHQDVPFERLVEELAPDRDTSLNPLFQAAFVLQNSPAPAYELAGLTFEVMTGETGTSKFDLSLSMEDTERGLKGMLEYSTDLFDHDTVARLVGHFRVLLDGVASNPSARLSALPLLADAERERLLFGWNDTRAAYPADRRVHQLVAARAAERPEALAVGDGASSLSYVELNARANRLANYLRSVGVGPETAVGVYLERSADYVTALLAVLKAGGAYVPLDTTYPIERVSAIVEDAGLPLLLTREGLLDQLPPFWGTVVCLDADREAIGAAGDDDPPNLAAPDNLAYVIYTSGSTGTPKGVELTHAGLANLVNWHCETYGVGPDDRATLVASPGFDASVWELWPYLAAGASLHVPDEERRLSPRALLDWLDAEGVTVSFLPTPLAELVLQEEWPASIRLRALLTGGDKLHRRPGEGLPCALVNHYGPTENTVVATCARVEAGAADDAAPSIGRPIANVQAYVLDPFMNPTPAGVPGELYVAGAGLARGYRHDARTTAEKFLPHPFGAEPGARLYRTGDLVKYDAAGRIEFIGRVDHQVKLRGFRIELGEIETALDCHPSVRQSVVVIHEPEASEKRLVAYVVPQAGAADGGGDEGSAAQAVSQWQALYEETYARAEPGADDAFNISGWNSSYTGEPIAPGEMREWVDATVGRIRALRPRRVLEIGCGTGLLLFPVAPGCETYVATDFSRATIDRLAGQVAARGLRQVTLLHRTADDFEGIADDSFDVVVLNSVVQYFPGADYLLRVLEGAARAVRPGGCVFVGDVRSLPLLEAFHTSVQMHGAPPSLAVEHLRRRVRKQMSQEEELVIDPRLFAALKERTGKLTHSKALLKRGRAHNELTKFRYDVVLYAGGETPSRGADWLDWREEGLSLEGLRELLADPSNELLAVRAVPNARVLEDVQAVRAAAEGAGLDDVCGLGEAARAAAAGAGCDPEDVWAIGAEAGYAVELSCASGREDGSFDAVFLRRDEPTATGAVLPLFVEGEQEARADEPPAAYANDPLREVRARELAPRLRAFLAGRLPEYMIPSAFVLLDELPVTPSGKVAREALPDPALAQADASQDYVPPRDAVEAGLADIWAEVLGVERVGVEDNFFAAGGHSLLATQVMARVRDALGVELPLRSLFESPTVEGLARRVEEARRSEQAATRRIARAPRDGALPLSFPQQRLWFLDQLEPGNPFYNSDFAVRLSGALDAAALARAFDEVVRRHESLRTRFVATGGEPVQVIDGPRGGVLTTEDLSGLPPAAREAEAVRLAVEEARRPFDLSAGPVFRARLLKLEEEEHVLLLTMHHIVSDWWSIGVFVREASALYDSFLKGEAAALPELPVQFADFAHWQRGWLEGGELARQRDYWVAQLSPAPPALELPTDRPRPAVQGYRGARRNIKLPPALVGQLKAMAEREGATLFMVLLAAFKVLLWRYTGQEDISVGTAIANRTRAEVEPLIGFFVNTLVLRTRFGGGASLRDVLGQVRERALEAYAHQDMPFERLVEEIMPERDLSRSPLFQVFFQLRNAPTPVPELTGVRVAPLNIDNETSIFDLTVTVQESPEGLTGNFRYNADLFDGETVERMIGHYRRVLELAVAEASRPVGQLSLLSADERRRVVEDWNATDEPDERPLAVHALFEKQARRTPSNVAVEFYGRRLTYAELNAEANRLAHHLRGLGVGPDSRVGLLLERGVEQVVAVLASLKAGGAYVPLDAGHPEERLRSVARGAGLSAAVTTEALAGKLSWLDAPVVRLDADRPQIEGGPADDPRAAVAPENLAYVLYTSGSTGRPKGVAMTHGALSNLVVWQTTRSTPVPARTLQFASLGFDVSFQEIFSTLASGGALVLVAQDERRDSERLLRFCAERSVERLFLPFVALQHLALAARRLNLVPPDLRQVITAGEQLHVTEPIAWMFERLEGATLHNQYGPTEAHVVSEFVLRRGAAGVWPELPPIGRPIRNARLYVLDDGMRPVPVGLPGELYIGGRPVARAYLAEPALTAERFVPDPFSPEPGSRLYRTGDRARLLPGGEIQFLGRADTQVKVRGYRVEPGEVEAALLGLEGVRQAAVVARMRAGAQGDAAGEMQLQAYVVPAEGAGLDAREVRARLGRVLPEYMLPSALAVLPELPLTGSGKVNRRLLPEIEAWAAEAGELSPPRGPVEEALAAVWAEVLGVAQVGARANFFELGGHSLLATRVMSRVREVFGVDVPLRALFEAPTVEGLGRVVAEGLRLRAEGGVEAEAGRIEPGAHGGGEASVSYGQRRLWFLQRLEPESAAYNLPMAIRLAGRLDVEALERTLTEVVRRHEILRTTFDEVAGQPVQVIAPAQQVRLAVTDLSGAGDEHERAGEARRLTLEEARRPFDLSRGPLLRAGLLKLGDEEHVALLTMHHIVSDGWSIGLLVKEVAALYEAFATGRPSPLGELPIQYADYAAWQRRWLDGGALERQLDYWREQLGGAPAALDLPTDRRPPAARARRGAHHPFTLPAGLARGVGELSRRRGTTTFMTLLAAFQALLARYSGQQDVSTGTPVAGRGRAETEELIGFFVNTLVLRTDLSGDPTFDELLGRVREVCLGAYAHGDVPFERLVEELQTERSLDHTPLFRVMFALQNAPLGELSLRGLRLSPVTEPGAAAMFDLTLNMQEVGGEIRGSFVYDTDLFDAATVERMAGHLLTLLQGAVARPGERVSALPLLGEAERRLLVEDLNDTRRDYPRGLCVHQLFEAQAARTPAATAVVCGDVRLTYAELNERADRLARHLTGLGVGPESLVGVCLGRSAELPVALLGVLKAGGAYVPLDPEYPRERIRLTLADAGVKVLLTEESLLGALPVGGAEVVCVDRDAEAVGRAGAGNPSAPSVKVAAGNLAYVIYTSGSTGRPKGVAIEHRSAAALLHWARETFSAAELARVLASTSVCFDLSVFELFAPLACGGSVVVARNALELPALGGSGVTLVNTVPSAMAELVRAGGVPDSVLTVNLAGEPLKRALAEQVYERTGAGRVWNLYGPSEDTTYSTAALVERGAPGEPTSGRPVATTRAYVLDPRLRPVPAGVAGELYLGGEGLARGYHGRPSLTAERFIPDPFSAEPGARLYRTGDLAKHLPGGGGLEFLGRVDHQVKVRGYRVELGEIESAARGLAWVRECVAAAWGEGAERRLVLYVEREPGAGWGEAADELRAHLRGRLPGWMVPEALVEVGRMPLTPTGKIDRRALPDPEPTRAQSAGTFAAPRTPVEELLAQVWSETLGLDGVGRDDNFFELGGHSLLATQAVSRVREALGVELPLRAIFEAQTPGELAAHVAAGWREGQGADSPPLAPAEREGDLPLSFAQQRLWFLDQMEPGLSAYNMPGAVRLTGALDFDALERSLAAVVGRHEVLRTRFAQADGLPVQIVNAEPGFVLALEDLRELDEAGRDAELSRRVLEEAERPFDLPAGPPVRARLFRVGDEEHVLLVTTHHIVSDGWSIGLLIREAAANYAAFVEGKESPAPPLPIQYRDYAVWQRGWLRGEALERQMDYWRRQLGGELPVLDLPADRPRPAVQSYRGARRAFELPAGLSAALKGLSRREGATLFMTVLAAFKVFLHRYTGADEVVVGTDIANRNRRETEDLIGFFANQLVLRTDVSGNPTFGELLGRVREVCLGAYAHQDVPFEKLVEELQPARDLSRPPLFQVKFVWQQDELEGVRMPGLGVTPFDVEGTSAKFDLTLFVVESERGLGGMLEYNTDIFDGERIGRMLEHFRAVLAGVAASPERPVGYLPLLAEVERRTVLDRWNATRTEAPHDLCVHQLFGRQARSTPEETALSDGSRQMSYAELDAQSNRLARHLRDLGVGPEVRVAVCLRRSLDMVTAVLGVLKAGGAYVPLDPSHPTERLSFMLEDAAAPVLLTEEKLVDGLPSHWGYVLCVDSEAGAIAGRGAEELEGGAAPDNLAYVIYTSGSTGRPKGVMVTHGGLTNYLSWCVRAYDAGGGAGAPVHSPLGFDLTVTSLFAPLVAGRGVTLLPEGEGVDALAEALASGQEFSLVKLTPSHLDALKGRLDGRHLARAAKVLVLGGEALAGEALEWWRANAPDARVVNEYGPTETVVGCCVYEVPAGAEPKGAVPIGRPIANTRLYVLDRRLQPVPVGVAGELYIAGDGVSRGYLNRPGLTAETFLPDPFADTPGARMYRSGDGARFRGDGTLDFLGRLDDQVKVRGYRVELGEVEAALRRHTSVREAAAALRKGTGGDVALVAYVVGEDGAAPDSATLRAFLKDKLPEYMIPSAFVALDALPLTSNGKVNRRALPAPERAGQPAGDAYVAPRTQAEATVAAVWEEVLGVGRVGVHDNFFDLGGHSLLATHLVHKAGTRFGVNLFLRDLFRAPTVAEFAVAVARKKAGRQEQVGEHLSLPPLAPAPAERYEPFPLTEIQEAYWIGRGGDFELSNVAAHGYLELEGEGLDLGRLNRAIRRCVGRHDMLRAVVTADGLQRVLERVPEYEVAVTDLRGLDPETVAAELGRLREEMSHEVRPADRWPLFEIRVSLLDGGRMRFYLSIDALICDAWSVRLLAADLARFYNDPGAEAAPPGLTFRDYMRSVLSLREGELYRDSAEYWRRRLPALPRAPELPLACDPGSLAEPQFRRREMRLGRDAWRRLKERAGALGLTHSGVLLAAYSEVLAAWSKGARFTVNLTLFNRLPLHPQVNELVGDFTSIILLAVDASRAESFETRALRLQEQLWDDIDHRHFSGVSVLRELSRQNPEGGPASMPVVFTSVLMPDWAEEAAGAGDAAGGSPLHRFEVVNSITQTPQVWLDNQVTEHEGELRVVWDAVEELFPEGVLSDMFDAYGRLLERLAAGEEAWREPSRGLLPGYQAEQRAEVNATDAPVPEGMLHTLFLRQVPLRAREAAVISPGRTLSYEELARLSNQTAHLLREAGARPNALVAVVMEKGWEQVVAVLAVLRAGAAYLPISPEVPAERLRHLLEHGEVELVLTQPKFAGAVEWPERVRTFVVSEEALAGAPDAPHEPTQGPEDLAYVIYTSGSTGLPKGVMIDHRGAVNTVLDINRRFEVGPEDRVLALSSLSFDLSVYDIFGTLAAGGAVVIPEPEAARDPARWARLVNDERVTVWNSVPALMELFVDYVAGRPEARPRGLRLVMLSGDWVATSLPERIRAAAPGARLFSLGGATEASIWSIIHPVEEVDPGLPSIPYGKPMVNQRFHVLNEALEPCPTWVPGDLYIGGVGLALGYWRDEALTDGSFVENPWTGERLYRTGDVGRYLPDGNIQFLGREDSQVKIQGYRVELGEVEAALAAHPEVRAAAVTAVGQAPGPRRLVGHVAGPADLSGEALREFLRRKLPPYMVPSSLTVLDELPLTPNGKVDRKALSLAAPEAAPAPAGALRASEGVRARFAALVASVMKLDGVEPGANLLELGASSIDIVRIVNLSERELGFRPRVDEFYMSPSADWLAWKYEEQQRAAEPSGAVAADPSPLDLGEMQTISQALARLKQLSREEVARLLAARRAEEKSDEQ
ncbi:MAG TPA: non-ribosomal peptide synthase/polyketide synthase [Pyrinomonadaceae bacterium]